MLHQAFLPGIEDLRFPEFDGAIPRQELEDLVKAVTAGYGTDVSALTGGRALQLQSMEDSLIATIQTEEDMRLIRKIDKGNAIATIHEHVHLDGVGGVPSMGFQGELDEVEEDTGEYSRLTIKMKYMATLRKVSAVQRSTKKIVDDTATENHNGILYLLSTTEWGLFYGDEACSSLEFDGLEKILRTVGGDHVYDLRGRSITGLAREIIDSQAFISDFGQFGRLTDYFCSNKMQADMSQKVDPAARYNPDGKEIRIGTPVRGIDTDWGPILSNPDMFIREGDMPWVARGGSFAANVAKGACTAPASVVGSAGAHASSQFATEHAGLFYYAVEAANRKCRSTLVKSAQVTVNAGERVTLTITAAGGSNETSYIIHRGRRNGTNADADFRQMIRIPKDPSGTTVYLDANQNIPGTSCIFLLNMKPGAKALKWLRLLPLSRFNLFPTNTLVHPWALVLFGGLAVYKPRQHRLLINALPSSATWKPF